MSPSLQKLLQDAMKLQDKECADLAARKKSLPVVAALGSRSPAAAELAKIYASGRPLTDDELRRAAEAVEHAGGRTWAATYAEERVASARRRLGEIVHEEKSRDLLAIADLITRRTH